MTLVTALLALDALNTEGLPGMLAVADAVELARDPRFELPEGSAALLRQYELIDRSGRMHDLTRQAILAHVPAAPAGEDGSR